MTRAVSATSRAVLLVLLGLAPGMGGAAWAAGPGPETCLARAATARFADPAAALPVPARLVAASVDLVPALVTGTQHPELRYAQRAIDRDLGGHVPPDGTAYTEVEVDGWKSPAAASALSFAVPGSGQIYTGSSRGYVFLGIEALAVYSFVHFSDRRDALRDEYYSYVGDPNQSASRFSFDRYAGSADPAEVARLRAIYERDQREFYDTVTNDAAYAAGWQDASLRGDARTIAEDSQQQAGRARFGLFVALANHVVSAADALNLARLNNVALTRNLSMKIKLRPGLQKSSYGLSVTQRF